MRKLSLIVAPALIAAMGMGTVASAQPAAYGHNGRHDAGRPTPGRDNSIRVAINNLNRDIDRAVARRAISNREATGLRRDAIQVQRLYGQYARNGLTRTETRTLQNRVDRIRVALRAERRDGDGRRR